MKTLILVRHAKSSWADASIDDMERPLNERGKKDAPEMAKRLKGAGISIDLILSSPAKRARKTAKYFAEEFNLDKKDIVLAEKLYEAGVPDFYDTVQQISDKNNSVILFSHNPGITAFVNTLTVEQVDDMPTCGLFALESNAKSWGDFRNSEKTFLFFDYPKSSL